MTTIECPAEAYQPLEIVAAHKGTFVLNFTPVVDPGRFARTIIAWRATSYSAKSINNDSLELVILE